MSDFEQVNLSRFRQRVRLARAWRGFAIGGAVGAALAALWSGLDLFGILYTSWPYLGLLVAFGALAGTVTGWLLHCDDRLLAKSIDRRAGLKDRLTASSQAVQGSIFDAAVREDAEGQISAIKPSAVYPLRVSKWHAGLLAGIVIASGVFLLGNSGILLSQTQKKERAEIQQAAPAVERVIKPLLDKPDKDPDDKELAEKLQQYHAELEKGRIGKQEAMQNANDLSKKADEIAQHKLEQAKQELASAKDALAKMSEAALEKEGLTEKEATDYKSPEEAQAAEQAMQQQAEAIRKELEQNKDAQGKPLSQAEKSALNDKLKQLEKQIELSQKAKDFLDRLQSNPEFKKLQEMMAKLAKGAAGQEKMPTDEELKQMIQKLEQLADKYKTDEEMKQFIEQLEKALSQCKNASQLSAMGKSLCMLQMPGMYGHPGPGNGTELYYANIHKIPLADKSTDIKAKAVPLGVTGDRQEGGKETYIETKGPSGLGAKSSVPYFAVLPKYRREAEKALEREQIPPEEQKRVKDYFDSLEENK